MRDANSAVYQHYHGQDISIVQIPLFFDRTLSHRQLLQYEEILTYVYSCKYNMCNTNAGNTRYHYDDNEIFKHCYYFLYDITEGHITTNNQMLSEIIDCIQTKCKTNYTTYQINIELQQHKQQFLNNICISVIACICETDNDYF